MSKLSQHTCLHFYRLCSIAFCLLLLSGCGSNTANNGAGDGGVTISSTPTSEGVTNQAYTLFKDVLTPDLQINMSGISCSLNGDSLNYPNNLVLATSQLTYDVGAAQTIQNYLQLLDKHVKELHGWVPPVPPQALQWLPGGKVCSAYFQITNLSLDTLTIERFGIRLTSASRPNKQRYHLVNYCRDVDCKFPPGGIGGDPPPCSYGAQVVLHPAPGGTYFDSQPLSTDHTKCPLPITLTGHEHQEILVIFTNTQGQNTLYTGIPALAIETGHGRETVAPATLQSTLAFTDGKPLPCYQFKDTSFYDEGDKSPHCFRTNNQTA